MIGERVLGISFMTTSLLIKYTNPAGRIWTCPGAQEKNLSTEEVGLQAYIRRHDSMVIALMNFALFSSSSLGWIRIWCLILARLQVFLKKVLPTSHQACFLFAIVLCSFVILLVSNQMPHHPRISIR